MTGWDWFICGGLLIVAVAIGYLLGWLEERRCREDPLLPALIQRSRECGVPVTIHVGVPEGEWARITVAVLSEPELGWEGRELWESLPRDGQPEQQRPRARRRARRSE